MKLVITGTPGTGKTSIARELSHKLGCYLFELNQIAEEKNLFTGETERGSKVVKLAALEKEVLKKTQDVESFVAEGHLACEFHIPCDAVLVLRANPLLLLKRMKKRGYSPEKIRDNLLCEILDYCLLKTELNYPPEKIIQINASKNLSPKKILGRINRIKSDKVDWAEMLLKNKQIQEALRE
ncbi:adenylate kinase family protein [Candidatus Micrarchaeota archaeon]|nr:adenylate kinase family protein [Candidatus Micrarchaeota archaeon]